MTEDVAGEDADGRAARTPVDGRRATARGRADGSASDLTDAKSWLVVVALAVCVIGFPAAILFWPPTFLSYRDAYFGLSMVPGLVLGGVAVWTALRTRRS